MVDVSAGHASHTPRISWWRDERKRAVLWQILVVAALLAVVAFIIVNMIINLRRLGVPLGFDFLDTPGGFALSFSLIPVDLDSSIARLILAGIINTLVASALGIILATIVGFLIGVMRLSRNYLISRLSLAYVETLRNIPLLIQLLFWYELMKKVFPQRVKDSINFYDTVFLNVRGIFFPRPVFADDFWWVAAALVVAVGVVAVVNRWSKKRQAATGAQFPIITFGVCIVILAPMLVSFLLGNPIVWELPVLGNFNFSGGMVMLPELTALVAGLSACTAAYIAEIVRGGIMAISHGQTEAAYALGLKSSRTLRLVVIPQALRVIVPPLTSQYLNIAKNTTLAGAVGYPDLYSIIGTAQNQTGRAVENVAILMAFFLSLSLLISFVMNWYNKRIALVER